MFQNKTQNLKQMIEFSQLSQFLQDQQLAQLLECSNATLQYPIQYQNLFIYLLVIYLQQQFTQMGTCQSSKCNPNLNLDFFINKYGLQTVLKIAADQQKKQLCMQKIPQVNKDYTAKIHEQKIQSIREINILENQLNSKITQRVKLIQARKPGLVSKAEKKHDKSAEQIMGMKKNKQKISKLRKQTLADFQFQENHVKEKIQETVDKFVVKIQNDKKSKIQQYDTLTQNDRACLKKQLQKRYKKQISETVKKSQQELSQSKECCLQNNEEITKIRPLQKMKQIKDEAQKMRIAGQHQILGSQQLLEQKDIHQRVQFQGCLC